MTPKSTGTPITREYIEQLGLGLLIGIGIGTGISILIGILLAI